MWSTGKTVRIFIPPKCLHIMFGVNLKSLKCLKYGFHMFSHLKILLKHVTRQLSFNIKNSLSIFIHLLFVINPSRQFHFSDIIHGHCRACVCSINTKTSVINLCIMTNVTFSTKIHRDATTLLSAQQRLKKVLNIVTNKHTYKDINTLAITVKKYTSIFTNRVSATRANNEYLLN